MLYARKLNKYCKTIMWICKSTIWMKGIILHRVSLNKDILFWKLYSTDCVPFSKREKSWFIGGLDDKNIILRTKECFKVLIWEFRWRLLHYWFSPELNSTSSEVTQQEIGSLFDAQNGVSVSFEISSLLFAQAKVWSANMTYFCLFLVFGQNKS